MHNKINVVFIDMDGTLIDTNTANSLAYAQAFKEVVGTELFKGGQSNGNSRLTLSTIMDLYPSLTEGQLSLIKNKKDILYDSYLHLTNANTKLIRYIEQNLNSILVLVSRANHQRVVSTLSYHNLLDYFDYFYCKEEIKDADYNKYRNAIVNLNVNPQNVLVFENEEQEVQDAILAGIPTKHITHVR